MSLQYAVSDSAVLAKRSTLHIIRSFDQVMSLVVYMVMFPVMFMVRKPAFSIGVLSFAEIKVNSEKDVKL